MQINQSNLLSNNKIDDNIISHKFDENINPMTLIRRVQRMQPVKKEKNKFFGPRLDGYNNMSANLISKYGDLKIKRMWIRRTPLMGWIQKLLNLVSRGVSKIEHDKLFHVALVVELEDQKLVSIEKLEDITIQETNTVKTHDSEIMEVPMKNKNITLMQLLNNARNKVGDEKFFDYDSFFNNCQYFSGYLLYNSGLLTKKIKDFLFQDLRKIIEATPGWAQRLSKFTTRMMATYSKITGKGNENEN